MRRALVLVAALAVAASAAAATAPGSWRPLPPAPIVADNGLASAWTGTELIVFGRRITKGAEGGPIWASANAAAAYDPATNRWRRLTPPRGPAGYLPGGYAAVWTGKQLIGLGADDVAYDPATNLWRKLPPAPAGGRKLVAWTGRELLGWGGGCCGDASADGVAYDPATNRWRKLPRSPLAGSQSPVGAWDGRELLVFVGNLDPDGKPWPARLARAAAYDPATNRWRRIAPLPAPRADATAVWDGHELLVVGGSHSGGFAYSPATNRWRRLPAPARSDAGAAWTGKRLLLWGGRGADGEPLASGVAFDPKTNRWSSLPPAPIAGRGGATAAWTGRELLVWGGAARNRALADGAAFRP